MRRYLILSCIVAAFLLSSIALPIEAQFNPIWQADYFDNPYFEDPAVFEREDGKIAFDWGTGSPASNIPAENFAVRWGTDVNLPAGTYRFYVMADEEVKIAVDFQPPVINTLGNSQIGQVVSADLELTSGIHHIQIDYREFSGNASIYFSFESLEDGVHGPDFGFGTPPTAVPEPPSDSAWTASYFANTTLFGRAVVVRQELNPSNNWGVGSPDSRVPVDNWSARWVRNIGLPQGTYRVSARADDGVRVFINDSPMILEWHAAGGTTYSTDINLPTGLYTFRIEMYEATGFASLDFNFELLGPPSSVVPGEAAVTINTGRLNVRSAPDPFSTILAIVDYGETFRALAFNQARTWVQIRVYGIDGWVNRSYVVLANADDLPVIVPPGNEQVTSYVVEADPYAVNIRSGPGTEFADLANLPAGREAQVIGRNTQSNWWQINYRGIVGWVSAVYAKLEPGANILAIPITD